MCMVRCTPCTNNVTSAVCGAVRGVYGGVYRGIQRVYTGTDTALTPLSPLYTRVRTPSLNTGVRTPSFNNGVRTPSFNNGVRTPSLNTGVRTLYAFGVGTASFILFMLTCYRFFTGSNGQNRHYRGTENRCGNVKSVNGA